VLAGNGYGIGAFKILRGMYEKVVTLGYLVKHQSEIQRFVDYEIVQRRRLMNRVRQNPHLKNRFTDADYDQIEASYQAVKDHFLDAKGRSLSWTALDMYSLAVKAEYDLAAISVNAYVLPNLKVHATISDLAERKVPQKNGTFIFNNKPQEQHADSALVTATSILITALLVHEDYFQLGMGPKIEQVQMSLASSFAPAGGAAGI